MEAVSKTASSAIIVDTRDPAAFKTKHIEDAVNWPLQEIMALQSPDEIPGQLRKSALYLVCRSGISSAFAVKKLKTLSKQNVFSVKGGVQAWEAGDFRESYLVEQLAIVIAAFGIKPVYMLLSLLFIILLWNSKLPDLTAIRWALIFFLAGEAFCAVNFLFFSEKSYLMEYLHMFGMVGAFGYTFYALMEAVDLHLVHYSDSEKKCAALNLCAACYKGGTTDVCGIDRVFRLLIVFSMVISFMPFLVSPAPVSYSTEILGSMHFYTHPVLYQLYEIRFLPLAAMVFFPAALVVFQRNKRGTFSRVLFASGLGLLGFSLFRLILFGLYRDNLAWFSFWEELTELLYVAGTGYIIWVFHGKSLPLPLRNRREKKEAS
jgi:rhodanese-related sulfurtransferase